nr:ThiF family adenylyltransferase [Chloroflexota bacterium]
MNQELTRMIEEIPPEELLLPRAIEFTRAAEFLPFVELLRSKRFETFGEIVDVRVEVELAQKRHNDIRKYEDISLLFFEDMDAMPMAFSLRPDFPIVPHLNLHLFPDDVKSLCLFEVPFSELKTRWSGAFLVKRLREWLALTAEGKLHQEDQPLEFFLPDANWNLVLPHDLFRTKNDFLYIYNFIDPGDTGPKTIFAQREPPIGLSASNKPAFIAMQITCEPQVHGLIHRIPSDISALNNFLLPGGVNLTENLRSQLLNWDDPELPQDIAEARLILLVMLPKIRNEGGKVEGDPELRAFVTIEDDIGIIGTKLGLWDRVGNKFGRLIGNKPNGGGENICIEMVNPMFTFSKALARTANKVTVEQNPKVTLIGVGALGSQVFLNLARSGYGTWNLLDKDILLPHNLARHALSDSFLGFPKSISLATMANKILNDEEYSKGIFEDVLKPKEETVGKEALSDADIILDISTSVAVGRHLANTMNFSARRISLFLNPSGTDLVMLAEDDNCEIPLDALEMQYYRALLHQPALENHLFDPDTPGIRYGYTCRDLSSDISQDDVLSHAAIGSRAFKQLEDEKGALISIWRLFENGEIKKISVDPKPHDLTRHPSLERGREEVQGCGPVLQRHGPPLRDPPDREIQDLPNRVVGRERTSLFCYFPQLGVQRLDRGGRVDHLADRLRIPEQRNHVLPACAPGLGRHRVLVAPLLLELVEGLSGRFDRRRAIDLPQILRH